MNSKSVKFVLILAILSFSVANVVFATDGVIDNAYKFAWGDYTGWVNFNPSNGNVRVSDAEITGFSWSESMGWIKLNPTNAGVKNDGQGNLSGKAWGENLGWIDFSNVKINGGNGDFSGFAVAEKYGKINFDCSTCKVRTTWRPTAPVVASPSGGGGGGGSSGGGGVVILGNTPQGNFSVLINNGALITSSTKVALKFNGGFNPTKMAVSNFSDLRDAIQENYKETKEWVLPVGFGLKTVYVKYYSSSGASSPVVSDDIVYSPSLTQAKKPIQVIKKAIVKIPAKIVKVIAKKSVTGKYNVFGGKTKLLTYTDKRKPVVEFSEDYLAAVGLKDFIVIKTADGKVDVKPFIAPDKDNRARIEAVTGEVLQIFIEPIAQSKNITGNLVFNIEKSNISQIKKPLNPFPALVLPINQKESVENAENDLSFSASKDKSFGFSKKIKIIDFTFSDENKDGTFGAELQIPQEEGEYEIVLNTGQLANKKIISLLVDSVTEGYVYEKYGNIDKALPGAVISLYWKNPSTQTSKKQIFGAESDLSLSAFELWNGEKYNQENPQETDKNGKFTFIAPEGSYFVKANLQGYGSYESNVFEIRSSGQPIAFDIELKGNFSWLKLFLAFILVVILIIIYRWRRRKKIMREKQNEFRE
ncbi:MAG: carboxypeptidase-like regulatory domain-containing protein [Patescibacteria group bacterium]